MDCDNSLCSGTRKGLFSIQKEFTCAICHELFVRPHTLSCSHSYCERCIISWMKRHQDCPTCRKPVEGKPIHSIALDNAVGKLVELRVENFAERSRKKNAGTNSVTKPGTKQYDCGTQTACLQQPPDSNRNKNSNVGARIRHFFHPSQNGGACHEFHFFNVPHYDDYSNDSDSYYDDSDSYYDDSDSYYDDDDYYNDYNGLPGYYWGGYGRCFNCGKCIGASFSSIHHLFCLQVILVTGLMAVLVGNNIVHDHLGILSLYHMIINSSS